MKKICLIVLSAVIGGMALCAQTNTNAAPQTPRGPTRIDSDSADFDMAGRKAVYHGNVRVDDPQMNLVCAQLTADLPPSGGRPNRIVAETNVVIDFTDEKGATNHATCDKAVYVYEIQKGATNETVTLTGNAKMENAHGSFTGEPIVWNRANDSLHADNYHMISSQNFDGMNAGTNTPEIKTNSSPVN